MKDFQTKIETLLRANQSRAVLASRDESGLPHLSPVVFWHVDAQSLWFSIATGSRTSKRLGRSPECAVSIVDWDIFEGLQIKGVVTLEKTDTPEANPILVEKARHEGAMTAYRLAVTEVYDVIPGAGKDLQKPLWRSMSEPTKPARFKFSTPALKPRSIPAPLREEIDHMSAELRRHSIPAYVATVNEQGIPNISPRFILEIGADHWLYGDGFRNKTFQNVSLPSPLAVAVVNWEQNLAFTAQGWTEIRYTGEFLSKVRKYWDEMKFAPVAVQAVLFRPESIDRVDVTAAKLVFSGNSRDAWLGKSAALA